MPNIAATDPDLYCVRDVGSRTTTGGSDAKRDQTFDTETGISVSGPARPEFQVEVGTTVLALRRLASRQRPRSGPKFKSRDQSHLETLASLPLTRHTRACRDFSGRPTRSAATLHPASTSTSAGVTSPSTSGSRTRPPCRACAACGPSTTGLSGAPTRLRYGPTTTRRD